MELRDALAFGGGDDDGVGFRGEVLREMLREDIVGGRRGVVETRETVEFAQAGFQVDGRLLCCGLGGVFPSGSGAGGDEGSKGLDAAVEGA